jgi:competence protein ComFC
MSFVRWPREVLEAATDLLYPPHCAACGGAVGRRYTGLCRGCRQSRIKLNGPRCAVCSQPYGGAVTSVFRCMNCGDRELFFEFATAAYRSRGVVRQLIHRFKYNRQLHLRHLLARMLAEGFRDERLRDEPVDGIVPVPLHPARRREREFNQAEVLGHLAGRRLGLPVTDCLRRRRYTLTQTHFHREERFENLQGAFDMKPGFAVVGRRLALVDDVITTGSTAAACAQTLLQGGAAAVVVITVARG